MKAQITKKTFEYSERPKTERPITEQRRNPNKFGFGMTVFGFRSFGSKTSCSVQNPTKLDRFIYINITFIYIKRSMLAKLSEIRTFGYITFGFRYN